MEQPERTDIARETDRIHQAAAWDGPDGVSAVTPECT